MYFNNHWDSISIIHNTGSLEIIHFVLKKSVHINILKLNFSKPKARSNENELILYFRFIYKGNFFYNYTIILDSS